MIEVDLTDGSAVVRLWTLVAGVGVGGLCAIGAAIVAIDNRSSLRRTMSIGCAVTAAVAGGCGWFLAERLARFDAVFIAEDGRWRGENGLGTTVFEIAADANPVVHFEAERLTGELANQRRSWVAIELPDGRRVASVRTHSEASREARSTLRLLAIARQPVSP